MYVVCCGGSNVHVPSEPGGMVSHRIYNGSFERKGIYKDSGTCSHQHGCHTGSRSNDFLCNVNWNSNFCKPNGMVNGKSKAPNRVNFGRTGPQMDQNLRSTQGYRDM